MKKILFPTDFSDTANNAFIYALQLADKMQAEIITLHTYELPEVVVPEGFTFPTSLYVFYQNVDIQEFENYRAALPSLRAIAEKNFLGHIEMKHALVLGVSPVQTILEVAEKEEVDLIVMGTEGASGLKEIFIGSKTGEVMENANCPVLSVPKAAKFDGKLDRFAMATDFSEDNIEGMEQVLDFAKLFDAHMVCVNVDIFHTNQFKGSMQKLESKFRGKDVSYFVLDGLDIESTLLEYIEDSEVDLMAMVVHKRSFWKELFQYSISKKLIYHAKTPILSIQAHTLGVAV